MERNATMLACSISEVERRIGARGRHAAHFATDPDAGKIADAFRDAAYDPNPDFAESCFLGMPQEQLRQLFYARHLVWAPDGDEAFEANTHQAERPARRSADRRGAEFNNAGCQQRRRNRVTGTRFHVAPSVVMRIAMSEPSASPMTMPRFVSQKLMQS